MPSLPRLALPMAKPIPERTRLLRLRPLLSVHDEQVHPPPSASHAPSSKLVPTPVWTQHTFSAASAYDSNHLGLNINCQKPDKEMRLAAATLNHLSVSAALELLLACPEPALGSPGCLAQGLLHPAPAQSTQRDA